MDGSTANDPITGNLVRHVDPEDPVVQAKKFLKKYELAKIVVVIDTHCLDNGCFVYGGDTSEDYMACSLEQVPRFTQGRITVTNRSIAPGLHS